MLERPPIPALTSLRSFAAVEVVIFHFFFPEPVDFWRSLFSAGIEAVTFFFVLSGFILAYVYSGRSAQDTGLKQSREFWKARFARIYPAYGLGLLIALPMFAYSVVVSRIVPLEISLAAVHSLGLREH
jgi:peptidoglycan/LPS O-acetylase OafA/YrhL